MFRSLARSLGVMALGITIGAGLSTGANADSGFLKDYSQLKTEKDPLGVERRIWVSPGFTGDKYQEVLIEKVVFYPEAKSSDQVPSKSLTEIRDYIDASLRKAVGSVLPLADKPGPGVARLRVAITAASVDTGLKPYQLVPVALVFTAAKEATGTAKHDVKLAVESEITDSTSSAPLARVVRDAKGIEVKGDEKLTLGMAKPKIDEWAESVRESLAARLKRGGTK
jgi:hypothetical protein